MMTGMTVDKRGYKVSTIVSVIKRIGYSREPFMVALRYFFIFMAVLGAIGNIRVWLLSFSFPHIFRKDFIEEFLISRAVLDGVNPYLPINKLADVFMGPLPFQVFQHPSPHPPPEALFCLPLGLLSYEDAGVVWFLFELACLSVSLALLSRCLGAGKWMGLASLCAFLILVWPPISAELIIGQLTSLMLILLVGAWQAVRSKKDIQGGILLGSAIAVKLVPWPIIIFLLLRRNWRASCAAVMTIAFANIAASMLMGFDQMSQYYLKVGMSVSQIYHASTGNFSLWTIGWRMFDGTTLSDWGGGNASPLFAAPAVAPFISIAIPFAMLILGFIFSFKARTFDTSFGILICVMILISPIAWSYFLILALIPLGILVHSLSSLNWPRKETNIAICVAITFFFSARQLMPLLTGKGIAGGLVPMLSFMVAMLSLLPAMGLLGLLWLLWRTDRFTP